MTCKLFFPIIREFNNISYFNSLVFDMKRDGHHVTVFCPKKHMSCYTYADTLLVNSNSVYDNCTSEYIEANKESFLSKYMQEIELAKKNFQGEIVNAPSQFNYFAYHIGDDWYGSIFRGTSKMLIFEKENFKWCVPELSRYDFWKSQRPYVVVNGRLLFKGNGTEIYNEKYEKLIQHFINNKIKVINTTLNSPGLQHPQELYQEPNCIDYLEQLAIFSNANMVYTISNAGAINQHLLCKANFCIAARDDGLAWVDNPAYGYTDIDVVKARKNINGVITERVSQSNPNFINCVMEMAGSNPPELNSFFDYNRVQHI